MRLGLSVAARDRRFSRAMGRVRPRFDALLSEFEKIELHNPIHEAILVGVTDDMPEDYFSEIPNSDGYFQVLGGCNPSGSDDEIAAQVFGLLRRAVRECPFSTSDATRFMALFDRHPLGGLTRR